MKVIDICEKLDRVRDYIHSLRDSNMELNESSRDEIADILDEYWDMLANLDVKGGPR